MRSVAFYTSKSGRKATACSNGYAGDARRHRALKSMGRLTLNMLLSARDRGAKLRALLLVEPGLDLGSAGQVRQGADQRREKFVSLEARMKWPFMFSSFMKSKREGDRPIAGRSKAAMSSSSVKNSWSPWLQPSRAR